VIVGSLQRGIGVWSKESEVLEAIRHAREHPEWLVERKLSEASDVDWERP